MAGSKAAPPPSHAPFDQQTAETLVDLIRAAMNADFSALRKVGSSIVKRLVDAGDMERAARIRSLLRQRSVPLRTSGYVEELPTDGRSRLPLVDELPSPSSPILLGSKVEKTVSRFIEDVHNAKKLSEAGIESGLRLILSGPPGAGKTLLASHIASRLKKPLHVARLDAMISSMLGETAKNIRGVFDFASTNSGALFLDEVDAIAKLRNDNREVGELKRIVNTLIQGLDDLDDATVVIAATNHPDLIDPAIWRRFPYRINISLPDNSLRAELWRLYLADQRLSSVADLLSIISEGLSPADIRELAMAARRASVISERPLAIGDLTRCALGCSRNTYLVPTGAELSADERRDATAALMPLGLKSSEIARLLGISRQRVDDYIHELTQSASTGTTTGHNNM